MATEEVTQTAQATPTAADVKPSEGAPAVDAAKPAEPVAPPVEAAKPTDPPAEAKPAEAKPTAEEKIVPEKYELKLPAESKLDQAALDRIALEAKELKMSAEEAQALVERENKAVSLYAQKQQDELVRETSQWVESLKSDKEFGGDNFAANAELSHRALKTFAPQGFVDMLEKTGLGNHPDLVRTFHKIGKAMANDSAIIARTAGVDGPIRSADVLFGPKK